MQGNSTVLEYSYRMDGLLANAQEAFRQRRVENLHQYVDVEPRTEEMLQVFDHIEEAIRVYRGLRELITY